MRSLPKFLGLAVAAGVLIFGWTGRARAQCTNDSDCGKGVCGWVCTWSTVPHSCVDKTIAGNEKTTDWCTTQGASSPDCNCPGATCTGTTCSPDVPVLPDGGPAPCNVDSECGSCGMVCSNANPDGGTVCLLADGGDPGRCDSAIGNTSCACKGQVCAVATNTCFPGFNVLDAGPNPCNVDSECGACGTVCFHDVSGTHACLGQVDAGIAGGFCLQTADCACVGQLCDTTTNFCNFPDAGPPVDGGPDAGPPDAGPQGDGGPIVFCLSDHDCTSLGNGGCGFVCGFKTTKPYRCVYATSGDPGICNVSGSADCLTCNGVTQTCDTSSHTCTPPQYTVDAGPPPDAGTATDGGAVDSGTSTDAGIKACQVDADCGQLDLVCSHASVPYHCVPVSSGDPGYCTPQSNGSNPCAAQGQTCINNKCDPPYGSDGGDVVDAGTTTSSGCGSAPAKGAPDLAALALALGLAGLAGLAAKRRRKLE